VPKRKIKIKIKLWRQVLAWILFASAVLALAAVMVGLPGCASTGTPAPAATPKYELTLSGTLDGINFQGVALGAAGQKHVITIASKNEVHYFIAKTCHRSEKHEDVISQGWIKETKSWSYQFSEAPTIEDTGDCPLRICVYSTTVGAPPVQCAVIDFTNPKYQLLGENICNGADGDSHGKNICHTQVGLVERVRFKETVVVADPLPPPTGATDPTLKYLIKDQCDGKFIDDANTIFQYVMPENECYVVFAQKALPHLRSKLTVIPYDLPLYSGGN
jgi:hypothetical protein